MTHINRNKLNMITKQLGPINDVKLADDFQLMRKTGVRLNTDDSLTF